MARELLPGLQVRTVSVPVRCVPPSYNAHSCVRPALKQSAALGDAAGEGSPSSRAHRSSRRRRRMDGCRRAGAACWARDPARFFLLPNRFAGIAWPAGGVPKTGRAAAAHSRSWSRRRAPAASSVKSRVLRAAQAAVLQRCPGSSERRSQTTAVTRAKSGAAKQLQCPSASRRPNCPSAARTRRRRHQNPKETGRPGSRAA